MVDIVFSVGCISLSNVALVQCWIYPSEKPLRSTETIWYTVVVVLILGGLAEGYLGLPMRNYLGVSWVIYGALAKAASTFVKYFY